MKLWGALPARFMLAGMAVTSILLVQGLLGCSAAKHLNAGAASSGGVPDLGLIAQVNSRAATEVQNAKYGKDFALPYIQKVQAEGSQAVFSPDTADGSIRAQDLAFALYAFQPQDAQALSELRIRWGQAHPGDTVWIGLSAWQRGSWEWHQSAGTVDEVLAGLDGTKYLRAPQSDTWVAIVVCGRNQVRLSSLRWAGGSNESTVSGYVKTGDGSPKSGVTVRCNDTLAQVTDQDGRYEFLSVSGEARLVPYRASDEFVPSEQLMQVSGSDIQAADFVVQPGCTAWPMYGHDARQARLSEVSGPQHGSLKWTYRTLGPGSPYWYPVVAPDGTVAIGAQNSCYSYSADGSRNWRFDGSLRFMGVPAIAPDKTVYFINDQEKKLYAIDSQGAVKWTFDLTINDIYWGYNLAADQYGAAIIDEDKISRIGADGQLLWTQPVEDDSYTN